MTATKMMFEGVGNMDSCIEFIKGLFTEPEDPEPAEWKKDPAVGECELTWDSVLTSGEIDEVETACQGKPFIMTVL